MARTIGQVVTKPGRLVFIYIKSYFASSVGYLCFDLLSHIWKADIIDHDNASIFSLVDIFNAATLALWDYFSVGFFESFFALAFPWFFAVLVFGRFVKMKIGERMLKIVTIPVSAALMCGVTFCVAGVVWQPFFDLGYIPFFEKLTWLIQNNGLVILLSSLVFGVTSGIALIRTMPSATQRT